MRNISDTIFRLASRRPGDATAHSPGVPNRLVRLADAGSNPGALRAHVHVPTSLRKEAALVVVLHGCTQTAAGYDVGAGWSEMADRHGFAVLFPEQQRQNNANLCFNWFVPDDSRRGCGEALSIRQMVEVVVKTHEIDVTRVFVTGLSAGGAMASIMLATYPEVFAGGAIIGGLPYGCATTVAQAFDRMRGHGLPSEAGLAALVKNASNHDGPWPTISVWHGSEDATVNTSNAEAILGQWRSLHKVGTSPSQVQVVDGCPRRIWFDDHGREVIEAYSIAGMGHGAPLDTSGSEGCGKAGPYMLEAGISSTRRICDFWRITGAGDDLEQDRPAKRQIDAGSLVPTSGLMQAHDAVAATSRSMRSSIEPLGHVDDVGKMIEDALRAAGLMR